MRRRVFLFLLILVGLSPAAAEPAAQADNAGSWAFRKPVRLDAPHVSDPHWVKNPIDAFVLARLDTAGLKPSAPADKIALLRRVTYDLTGLPPTLQELDDFLADDRPDAYARVVDRLLASPHFGERWAQHWLDVVRYAESNGYEADGERPHAWRYRDYVVKAFNDDKPYDRFLTEQLAGDLLAGEASRQGVAGADKPEATGVDRGRLQPLRSRPSNQRQCRSGRAASGTAHRDDQRRRRRLPRPHGRLLPLPRPQVRPAAAERLLPPPGVFQRRPAEGNRPFHCRLNARTYARLNQETDAKIAPLKKQAEEIEAPVRERLSAAKKAKLECALPRGAGGRKRIKGLRNRRN